MNINKNNARKLKEILYTAEGPMHSRPLDIKLVTLLKSLGIASKRNS
jgi:hypothetical protein